MIGHWLLQLSREQEDRVLTTPMGAGSLMVGFNEGRCVMGAAGMHMYTDAGFPRYRWPAFMVSEVSEPYSRKGEKCHYYRAVWYVYDTACGRFGIPRVAAAIRNRILSNRAWRELTRQEQELVAARA